MQATIGAIVHKNCTRKARSEFGKSISVTDSTGSFTFFDFLPALHPCIKALEASGYIVKGVSSSGCNREASEDETVC